MIRETLNLIKEQTGLTLEPCPYFTGVKRRNGKKYFNVVLKQRVSESMEYMKLERFADKYKLISVHPCGVDRAVIFVNN